MNQAPTFRLPEPEYEAYTWRLQDEHGPTSVPPLLMGQRAHRALPSDGQLPRVLYINGYMYQRMFDTNEPRPGQSFGAPFVARNVEDMQAWRGEWLPQVEQFVIELEKFDPASVPPGAWGEVLASQIAEYQRIFGGVHRTAAIGAGAVARRFELAFLARFGESDHGRMLKLLQGFPNCSLERACCLWDLSRELRAYPELLESMDHRRPLPDSPAFDRFKAGFERMIGEYGYTTNAELEDVPTWREDSSIPMAVIRAYARQGDERSPREAAKRQAAERLEIEEALRSLAGSDQTVAELIPLMEMAQYLAVNQEDHNLLVDQRMAAASRARWLSIGALLKSTGKLAEASDVFYLQLPELIDTLESRGGVPLEEIGARKAALRACRATLPPSVLGKPLDTLESDPRVPMTEMNVLSGIAASAGTFRGTARVIETLADAARLEQGDVLVCRSTTPSWTPLFGIVSAVVTDSGGALSHGAIVAREFGLPAVAGTIYATSRIPDGAVVTVDGTNGLVVIERVG